MMFLMWELLLIICITKRFWNMLFTLPLQLHSEFVTNMLQHNQDQQKPPSLKSLVLFLSSTYSYLENQIFIWHLPVLHEYRSSSINHHVRISSLPVDTRRCFNVDTTSCVYRKSWGENFLEALRSKYTPS